MFQEVLQSRAVRLVLLVAILMWIFEADPQWVQRTQTGEEPAWRGDPARREWGRPIEAGTDERGAARGVRGDGPAPQCTGFDRHTFRDAGLDGIDLGTATQVAADRDGGFWILADTTVRRVKDNRVDRIHDLPGTSYRMAIGPRGEVAVAVGDAVTMFGPDPDSEHTFPLALPEDVVVGGLAVTEDGTILVGDTGDGHITALQPDGGVRRVLTAADDDADADARVDEPLGPIDALVALPDGRIAFLTWRDASIGLVDGNEVRRLQTAPADDSRWFIGLGFAPGGLLLAVAAGPETHPQIQTVDVGTGTVRTVADLPRNGTASLSATAVGDDVVFLAEHQLCRLTGVLG